MTTANLRQTLYLHLAVTVGLMAVAGALCLAGIRLGAVLAAFAVVVLVTTLTLRPLIRGIDANARLAHSRKLYSELFSDSNAVMLLIDPASGRIVDANAAAAAFYGYPRERLLTMAIQDINMLTSDEVAAERRKAQRRDSNTFRFRHRLSSGAVRDVEVHSTPLTWDGRDLLFSVVHDITWRMRLEAELNEANERLNLALAKLGLVLVKTLIERHDGRITFDSAPG